MNAQGGTVGTSQIAEHLGISPGNLYYHFRNREEILRELFAGMDAELDEVLRAAPGETIDAVRLADFYIGGARVLWRYRFFFASATDFIGRDAAMAEQYVQFSERSRTYMRHIIQSVVTANPGRCTPTSRECGIIAESMWVLWVSWPRYSELSRPGAAIGEADIGHGLEQIASILAPYVDPSFYRKVIQLLQKFLKSLPADNR